MNELTEQPSVMSNLTNRQKQIKLLLAKRATMTKREFITYSELCEELALPYSMANPHHRNLLSEDLGAVSAEEVDVYDWPMLSCLVVVKETGMPAMGFFKWAEEVYGIKLRNEEARDRFFVKEFKKTVESWSSPEGQEEIRRLENELSNPNKI